MLPPPGYEEQTEAIRDALDDQEGVVFATSGSCGPPKWVMFKRNSSKSIAIQGNRVKSMGTHGNL